MKKTTKYTHRCLARIVIEASTPIAVGTGGKDFMTDAIVATDVNGLPYIPGTALAGIFRGFLSGETEREFGHLGNGKPENSRGSNIVFSSAHIIDSENRVMDGWQPDAKNDKLLKHYNQLPIRQHVRINAKGANAEGGKFDGEVVYKGTRWAFEVEMVAENEKKEEQFKNILDNIYEVAFRVGSGTRSGLGELEVVEYKLVTLDLKKPDDLTKYLDKTADLNDPFWATIECKREDKDKKGGEKWDKYELTLTPDDFFLFGSGLGDENADMTAVTESCVKWENNVPTFETQKTLIPATSVKGALAHRTAFHYNKQQGRFADQPDTKPKIGFENDAVFALFGSEDKNNPKRGNVLFSDVILENKLTTKVLNHVSIDRFTGGAIAGALFSEAPNYGKGEQITCTIWVKNDLEKDYIKAFNQAINDLCIGMLPLGGGVNRGNGCFNGVLRINGKEQVL